jgi:hypothetical protein
MLMGKKQSIASFIEKLPMDGSVGDCESTLLTTNMNFMGGATTNSNKCANASVGACDESTNDKHCSNTQGACDNSKNVYDCKTSDIVPGITNKQCPVVCG